MRRSVRRMVGEFREHWNSYVLQSLLAAVATFIVLILLSMEQVVITGPLTWDVFTAVVAGAVVLALAHHFGKGGLRDLT